MRHNDKKQGFATLFSVVVLMLISLLLIISVIGNSSSTSVINSSLRDGIAARALANSCVNHALNKLKIDANYKGNESLDLDGGLCKIEEVSGSGNNPRTIVTSGMVNNAVKKIEVSVQQLQPVLIINYWIDTDY